MPSQSEGEKNQNRLLSPMKTKEIHTNEGDRNKLVIPGKITHKQRGKTWAQKLDTNKEEEGKSIDKYT